jgi:hypothetical protein
MVAEYLIQIIELKEIMIYKVHELILVKGVFVNFLLIADFRVMIDC